MNQGWKWMKGIRGNLLMMVAVPMVLLGVLAWVSQSALRSQQSFLTEVVNDRLPETQLTGEMRTSLHALARYLWLAHARDQDQAGRKKALDEIKRRKDALQNSFEKFVGRNLTDTDRKAALAINEQLRKIIPLAEKTSVLLEKNTPEADEQVKDLILNQYSEPAAAVADILREMAKADEQANREAMLKSEENTRWVNRLVLFTSIGGSFALFLIGFWIASRLASRLGAITQNIGVASTQVGSASEQLSEASQKLSSGATEGAASLEETVSSLEELTSMVKMNADNSKEAATLAQTTTRAADDGETEIRKLIEAMSEVARGSKKIEEIINVIDDIAFQTNLLALNAAVEAARAGEQGKGFAVVAEAVRNLAQRSSAAAKDINTLIKDSVQKTEHGAKIADQSGAVLKNIVSSIKKVSELNQEIATASQQQSDGLGQISKAMNQLDIVTQGNASAAEEAAAASEEMSAQAVTLGTMVGELTTIVEGAGEGAQAIADRPERKPVATQRSRAPGQVISLNTARKNAASKPAPEDVIPFDDEQGQKKKKIGTIDGF